MRGKSKTVPWHNIYSYNADLKRKNDTFSQTLLNQQQHRLPKHKLKRQQGRRGQSVRKIIEKQVEKKQDLKRTKISFAVHFVSLLL